LDQKISIRAVPEFEAAREMGSGGCGKFNVSGIDGDQGQRRSSKGAETPYGNAKSQRWVLEFAMPGMLHTEVIPMP
jgi:hypothetical protein